MAPRSPLSLRSKISTEITLVSEVNSMMAADSSRITPTKMKHQVAITLVRSSGAVMSRERAQPRGAEDAARVLELGMHGAERRLELLIGGRQRDGDEGDQQDPQRAVEHERRPRVAQEQPDAEHDAGDRDRRGGEEPERAVAGDRLARRHVADHHRDGRCRWSPPDAEHERVLDRELGRRQLEEHEIDVVQREVVERDELRGDARERRVEQRAIGQEHRVEQQHEAVSAERHPFQAPSRTSRGSPCLPPTTE